MKSQAAALCLAALLWLSLAPLAWDVERMSQAAQRLGPQALQGVRALQPLLVSLAEADDAARLDGVVVFHAGTARRDGALVTAGGRVLGVQALGRDIRAARDRAYEAMDRIAFPGMHARRDIARRALGRA